MAASSSSSSSTKTRAVIVGVIVPGKRPASYAPTGRPKLVKTITTAAASSDCHEEAHILTLPVECLCEILKWITRTSDKAAFSLVCLQFRAIRASYISWIASTPKLRCSDRWGLALIQPYMMERMRVHQFTKRCECSNVGCPFIVSLEDMQQQCVGFRLDSLCLYLAPSMCLHCIPWQVEQFTTLQRLHISTRANLISRLPVPYIPTIALFRPCYPPLCVFCSGRSSLPGLCTPHLAISDRVTKNIQTVKLPHLTHLELTDVAHRSVDEDHKQTGWHYRVRDFLLPETFCALRSLTISTRLFFTRAANEGTRQNSSVGNYVYVLTTSMLQPLTTLVELEVQSLEGPIFTGWSMNPSLLAQDVVPLSSIQMLTVHDFCPHRLCISQVFPSLTRLELVADQRAGKCIHYPKKIAARPVLQVLHTYLPEEEHYLPLHADHVHFLFNFAPIVVLNLLAHKPKHTKWDVRAHATKLITLYANAMQLQPSDRRMTISVMQSANITHTIELRGEIGAAGEANSGFKAHLEMVVNAINHRDRA